MVNVSPKILTFDIMLSYRAFHRNKLSISVDLSIRDSLYSNSLFSDADSFREVCKMVGPALILGLMVVLFILLVANICMLFSVKRWRRKSKQLLYPK